MDDYALVFNAGSSSLKFCVYQRSEAGGWRIESRGQIEGIGTAPRLSVRDGGGGILADQHWIRVRATSVPRWILWRPGCAPDTAAQMCLVSATASFMAVHDSPVPQ